MDSFVTEDYDFVQLGIELDEDDTIGVALDLRLLEKEEEEEEGNEDMAVADTSVEVANEVTTPTEVAKPEQSKKILCGLHPEQSKKYLCGTCCFGFDTVQEFLDHERLEEHQFQVERKVNACFPGLGFCLICSLFIPSALSWRTHKAMWRHRKALFTLIVAGRASEDMVSEVVAPGKTGTYIDEKEIDEDKCKENVSWQRLEKPIIGLKHITNKGENYACSLCGELTSPKRLLEHITSKSHALECLKKDHVEGQLYLNKVTGLRFNRRFEFVTSKALIEELGTESERDAQLRVKVQGFGTESKLPEPTPAVQNGVTSKRKCVLAPTPVDNTPTIVIDEVALDVQPEEQPEPENEQELEEDAEEKVEEYVEIEDENSLELEVEADELQISMSTEEKLDLGLDEKSEEKDEDSSDQKVETKEDEPMKEEQASSSYKIPKKTLKKTPKRLTTKKKPYTPQTNQHPRKPFSPSKKPFNKFNSAAPRFPQNKPKPFQNPPQKQFQKKAPAHHRLGPAVHANDPVNKKFNAPPNPQFNRPAFNNNNQYKKPCPAYNKPQPPYHKPEPPYQKPQLPYQPPAANSRLKTQINNFFTKAPGVAFPAPVNHHVRPQHTPAPYHKPQPNYRTNEGYDNRAAGSQQWSDPPQYRGNKQPADHHLNNVGNQRFHGQTNQSNYPPARHAGNYHRPPGNPRERPLHNGNYR